MRLVLLTVICCATLMFSQTAAAEKKPKKEEVWAACIWKNAPTSAGNWQSLTPSKSSDIYDRNDKFQWLGIRLQSICRKELTPVGKKTWISFDAEKVWAVLPKFRPQIIGEDTIVSDAWRCEVHEEDLLLGISVGFGERPSLRPGQPNVTSKCQTISSSGDLVDA